MDDCFCETTINFTYPSCERKETKSFLRKKNYEELLLPYSIFEHVIEKKTLNILVAGLSKFFIRISNNKKKL